MSELQLARHFASNLKEMLDYNNTSQKELSEDTGISEATISYYMRGERIPSLKNVLNIAYALECKFSELISIDEFIV